MQPQNFKNHSRIVPVYHLFASLLFIFCLAGSSWNLAKALLQHSGRLTAAILFCLSYGGVIIFWYVRAFALKAQDRAIRSEENLRHFVLTGKLLDKRLRLSQIIALRFADDAEFLPLAGKAADENMKPKQIKEAISAWRADYHRV